MKSLIIVNPADCIGCRTCEVACVVAHPSEQVVQTNSARCIGCQSCVSACPFGMITIQSLPGDTRQQIVKCDLCEQREEGPACVESCPTQALQLLTERELRRVRQQRIVASGENPL
ncbi:4Fe-4S dicluster domain-containing protein [Escherichia coli]|nr:4Fe-4S dicluster domain-containing protein [Escherichia coli]ELJ0861151.1 4Fe-4S dicluster domain-containing protein [Escherichia coli]ELJ1469744.1 4Fe-4S dicluster domain-containing protein [Escherichia coli]ELW9983083.1 4Fe-4S dicluster domain-containing protein [Escherichia coli]